MIPFLLSSVLKSNLKRVSRRVVAPMTIRRMEMHRQRNLQPKVITHCTTYISSFDLYTEMNIKHLKKGSKVISGKALKAFVDNNSHRPHAIAHLEQVLDEEHIEEEEHHAFSLER